MALNIWYISMTIVLLAEVYLLVQISKIKKQERELVKQKYPDLTPEELRSRKLSIRAYTLAHLYGKKSRVFEFILIAAIFLIGIAVGLLITGYYYLLNTVLLVLLILVFGVVLFYLPNYQDQQEFVQKYLDEHPDNTLKFVSVPSDLVKKVMIIRRLSGVIACVMVVLLLIFGRLY
ncbi:hypothetical protein [Xylocopilactobacillus apis]|uniref:Integral membrane protein n=1 Tax=Xylocopilactobacillus apis TaxID=2932183 RepID=A0AAU9DJ92_9LACO|nr:hypothetical protein [Xylocopilactobacillus apis]BDR55459.1 hypothetical protein KIMC2_00210 [Xylocopilactobacillus apis]